MVSSKDKPENYPIYSMETELGSLVFYNDSQFQEENQKKEILLLKNQSIETELK
jgi:hypothetical protein